MKTCKNSVIKCATKLILVLVLALSSLGLFACKPEDPTITTSVTVSSFYVIPDGVEVVLNEENPNQTITIDSMFAAADVKLESMFKFTTMVNGATTNKHISDSMVNQNDYIRLNKCIKYYVEDSSGNLQLHNRSNTMLSHVFLPVDDKIWDYSTVLNEEYKKHVLEYKIDQSLFPEIYGKAPYAEQYIEYSLTILVEDNTGDREVEFKINGAVQTENIGELEESKYFYNARTFLYEKTNKESDYVLLDISVIDKNTKEIICKNTGETSNKILVKSLSVDDNKHYDLYNSDMLSRGLYVIRIAYEGNETYAQTIEYVYIYVYESL